MSLSRVTSQLSLRDGWLCGWVSADHRPLSRVMPRRLDPDWPVHATVLSIQEIFGLPRFNSHSFHKSGHHAGFNVVVLCHQMPEISQPLGFDVTWQFTFRSNHLVNLFSSQQLCPWNYQQFSDVLFLKACMRLFFNVHASHPCVIMGQT